MTKYNATKIGQEIQYIGDTIENLDLHNGHCYFVEEIYKNHILIKTNATNTKIKNSSYYTLRKF